MTLDCHVHILGGPVDRAGFQAQLSAAGVDGALVISIAPRSFGSWSGDYTSRERLDNLFEWVGDSPNLLPFYWIDPIEDDALDQVALAVGRGVRGFKCICNRFFPRDERAMTVFRGIADSGKPVLFHSGILFDGTDSSRYSRPVEFEPLIDIPGLKFALAHMSWPWCDELIAVFGKFESARSHRPGGSAEMFIDTTPGTPRIYREDALRKLFTVGYDVRDRVMFGSDQTASRYKPDRVRNLIARDTDILRGLDVGEDVLANVTGGNLRRFLGI